MANVEKTAKSVKMIVSTSDDYVGVNVRNKDDKVIGIIPNGNKVTLIGKFDESKERTYVSGRGTEGKIIKGTVLTSCLK